MISSRIDRCAVTWLLKDFNYRWRDCPVRLATWPHYFEGDAYKWNFLTSHFLKHTKLGSRNCFLYQVYCKNYKADSGKSDSWSCTLSPKEVLPPSIGHNRVSFIIIVTYMVKEGQPSSQNVCLKTVCVCVIGDRKILFGYPCKNYVLYYVVYVCIYGAWHVLNKNNKREIFVTHLVAKSIDKK